MKGGDYQIGGLGEIVEIDEVLIVRIKYNRDRILVNESLIFGEFKRVKGAIIEILPDKSKATLLGADRRGIKPGTNVMSDGRKSYHNIDNYLPDMALDHKWLNHFWNSIDPNDPNIHTQIN